MLKNPTTTLILALLLISGCKSAQSNQTATAPGTANPAQVAAASPAAVAASPTAASTVGTGSAADACSLLTSDEIRAVQGEPLKTTKRDDRATGPFLISICYYELPTAVNSVSLSVTQSNGSKAGAVREYWEDTFGQDERKSEKEREREGERKKAEPRQRMSEEEEEGAPMERVSGIGEEAFWSGSRVGGALFVLKKDRYIRISVGGKASAETKLKRSKTLAAKVLTALG
jgi:hypothetical protein